MTKSDREESLSLFVIYYPRITPILTLHLFLLFILFQHNAKRIYYKQECYRYNNKYCYDNFYKRHHLFTSDPDVILYPTSYLRPGHHSASIRVLRTGYYFAPNYIYRPGHHSVPNRFPRLGYFPAVPDTFFIATTA
jgi:hypothetical protein